MGISTVIGHVSGSAHTRLLGRKAGTALISCHVDVVALGLFLMMPSSLQLFFK